MNLMVFSLSERGKCNVLGKQGKNCLPLEKMAYIKEMVLLKMFHLDGQVCEKKAWSAGFVAID